MPVVVCLTDPAILIIVFFWLLFSSICSLSAYSSQPDSAPFSAACFAASGELQAVFQLTTVALSYALLPINPASICTGSSFADPSFACAADGLS